MLSLLSFPTNLFLLFGLLFILATIMNFKRGLLIFLFLTPLIPMSISLYLGESVPLVTFHRVGLIVLILGPQSYNKFHRKGQKNSLYSNVE